MRLPKSLAGFLFLFTLCQISAFLVGNMLQFSNGFSAFWAPTGVCMVGLLLAPYKWWPPLLILQTIVDTTATVVNFDVLVLPDDSIKVGLAAYFVRRLHKADHFRIDSLKSFLQLILTSALCFSVVAIYSAPSSELWLGYWMGDLLGVTMIAPMFFLEHASRKESQKLESVIALVIIFVATRVLFLSSDILALSPLEYPYVLFPLLLWVSVRLPDRFVTFLTIMVAALSVYYTGLGKGPFLALPVNSNDQLLLLQVFLLFLTTGPTFLSLTVYERQTARGESRRYRADRLENERVYQRLFETSGVAIGIIRDRKLVRMNTRFGQVLRTELGHDPLALCPEKQFDDKTSSQVADELYLEATKAAVNSLWKAKTGESPESILDLTLFPLPDTDEVVMTALDVTKSHLLLELLAKERESLASRVELRSAELLQANTDLARSVQGQREFIAHLSHEFKTPLTALLAHSETLLEGLFGPLNGEQKTAIIDMRNNGERLSRLILDLLDLNRLEADQVTVQIEPFEIGRLVKKSADGVSVLVDRAGLQLLVDGESDAKVTGDLSLCTKAVTLLLSRAARQTPDGGEFGITVSADSQMAEVNVWDQGPRIPEQALLTIEDPYAFRWEDSSRAEHGITFAVAARFLTAGGGTLSAYREDNKNYLKFSFPVVANP